MTQPIDLNEMFANRQDEFAARLTRARSIPHPTSAGDEGEENWALVLREFLPRRYGVARHRYVIDADGGISLQQDIVIYDWQFAPTFLVIGETEFIPIESVYAVFEVKPKLNRKNVIYAAERAASVRALSRNPGLIRLHTGELVPGRQEHHVIGGILCHESTWKEPFGLSFSKAVGELDEDHSLELGCVVTGGAFYQDENEVHCAEPDRGLVAFCVSLFDALQKAGNAAGVNALAYASNLWQ